MNKRITSLALLLASLIITTASCGGADTGSNQADTTAAGGDQAAETTAAETERISYKSANLPEKDFEGYNIRFRTPKPSYDNAWWYIDTETENGEILNDAIYERNATIEDAFNVEITCAYSDTTDKYRDDLKNAISAGDDLCDIAFGPLDRTNPLFLADMLIDLNTVDHINFEQPWWDQGFVESFTINNKLFFGSGDISSVMDLRTYAMVFNKDLADKLGYDYPYEAVRDNKWTREYFLSYVKGVNSDVNGDGQMNYDDRWGYFSENQCSAMLAVSFDAHIAELDENGKLVTKLLEERNLSRLSAAMEIIIDKEATIWANPLVQENGNSWPVASKWFAEGGALIRSASFETVPRDYRTMEQDFGIIPFPKYDEAQENYRTVTAQTGNIVALPVTVNDPDRAALILEAMAAESVETIKPAFYDVCLTGKYVRDDESSDMIEIILDNKVYDLGYIFNIASFRGTLQNLEKAYSADVASAITSIESAMQKALDEQMEIYNK